MASDVHNIHGLCSDFCHTTTPADTDTDLFGPDDGARDGRDVPHSAHAERRALGILTLW